MKLLAKYFLAVVLSSYGFPQVVNGPDSVRILRNGNDSLKIFNPFKDVKDYQPFLFYNKEPSKWQIFVPGYNLGSSKYLHSNTKLLNYLSNFSGLPSIEDELESFKISLKILSKIEYKNRMKYDLGELGNYLGLSRNIMAVIFAILSLLKH